MIIDEYKKKEKDEALLADLCECYSTLVYGISYDLKSICVPCLVKAGLKKGNDENTKKEVEITLLALNHMGSSSEVPKELYINEIKEIIEYHQEHHNLTRIAYQSAWQFLICRVYWDEPIRRVIVNELHFAREAIRELEELTKCVDWKREKEE
ncbi:uncharacterized protein MONOS_18018 [Monocercomonoides exilis]|uniref:uncharacterized protein n=1 Tax=Monocercomonoides exilis TaxID=2049356 RepID=UPI003559B9FF|nr:hypothetical protein MONOS_18018 [Monocercomonoides exilis]